MFQTKQFDPDLSSRRTYTGLELARIAGVSLRQLQWWDERKVVSPRHQGHRRVYQLEQALEITLIAELRRKGLSLQKIRRLLRFLRREMSRRLRDVLSHDPPIHLLTDGKSIYFEHRPEQIINLLKRAREPIFLVCVSDQIHRLIDVQKKTARPETASNNQLRKAV
jgi:DNA-binding transcriptional MerR regulator